MSAVITFWHLSELLFFGLLSFSLVLSAKKIVFWLYEKFTLIMTGEGQYDLTKKCDYSKMHSCTAAQLHLKAICFSLLVSFSLECQVNDHFKCTDRIYLCVRFLTYSRLQWHSICYCRNPFSLHPRHHGCVLGKPQNVTF